MTYDEVVDNLIRTMYECEHKKGIAVDRAGNVRQEFCRHKPEECEYKRWLIIEAKMSGGATCPMK